MQYLKALIRGATQTIIQAILVTLILVTGFKAFATDYQLKFTDESGHQVSSEQAIIGSLQGKTMFKCQTVEAKVSKAGTSIGIRNIKKPKKED